jgi:4'-phosphopantetheinyl transferase
VIATAAAMRAATPVLPRLDGDDVHVWLADLESDHDALLGALSADEAARARRFWFDRDRRHYAACRAILRYLLGAYLGADPRALKFESGAAGKPFIANAPIAFNVSHSGSHALVAISRCGEIGVDIEAHRPLPDRDALARQCFSPREVRCLQSLPDGTRTEAFFTCWSRKEAFVKAVGDGLSYPLETFDVTFAPGEVARLDVPGHRPGHREWILEALDAPRGYAAALVTEGRRRTTCWSWTTPFAQEMV